MHLERSGSSIPAHATKKDTLTSAWCHPRSRGTIFFFPPSCPGHHSAHPICGSRFLFMSRSQNSPSLQWLLQRIITRGLDYSQKKCLHTSICLQINRASHAQTRLKDQLSHLSRQHLSQVLTQSWQSPNTRLHVFPAWHTCSLEPPRDVVRCFFLSKRKDKPTEITLTLNLIAYQALQSNTDGMRVIFLLGETYYYYITSVSDI